MTSTIQSSKNTFEEGLIMDLSPIHTPANSMTSALNATFITYNGNEMSLQNDMGNGRIETARLPEGYIPVGTCEFGDIIYIISYNPLDNKALIGCFPSPERNISSDEISDLKLRLSYKDFQDCDANGNPTGTFKKTVIKKVLLDSKKLNPGDKYIIYSQGDLDNTGTLLDNKSYLSDYGKDGGPKTIKLHVVSIEDSGKITYLDTTTKWYNDFYIKDGGLVDADGNSDLDSYRNLVSSEWSIFNSKTSGKLAILAELETIDSFSCSYVLDKINDSNINSIELNFPSVDEPNPPSEVKNYKLSLETEYTAKDGIVLPAICITDAIFPYSSPREFPNTPGSDIDVKYRSINSGKIEYYKALENSLKDTYYTVYPNSTTDSNSIVEIDNFSIPFKEVHESGYVNTIKSESFIYNMSIVPIMGKIEDGNTILYGKLDHLAVNLTIDFNKIGSGISELNTWKYHNSDNMSVFTFGLFSDPKPGYEIKFVQIDFYDNLGHVAQYLLNDKKSYNGIFTEYFTLNSIGSNTRLSRYKLDTNNLLTKQVIKNTNDLLVEIIKHKAEEIEISEDEKNRLSEDDYIEEGSKYYRNDAGTLYSNALYAAKITIWLATKSGSLWDNSQVFYRWYWTNTMFNDNYYDTLDFDILPFNLALDSKTAFATTENYKWEETKINNLYNSYSNNEHYNTYSANVQHIGIGKEDNLKMYIIPGLANDYGCFNLLREKGEDDGLKNNIKVEVYLGTENINYNLPEELYSFSNEPTNITESEFLSITPKTKLDVTGDVNNADIASENPPSINNNKDKKLENDFTIKFGENIKATKETLQNDTDQTVTYLKWIGDLENCYYYTDDDKKGLPLNLQAILYNKAYTLEISQNSVEVPVYTPIINSAEDFTNLGLDYKFIKDEENYKIKMGLVTAMSIMHHEGSKLNKFSGINFKLNEDRDNHPFEFNEVVGNTDDANKSITLGSKYRDVNTATDGPFIEAVWNPIKKSMRNFFLVYPGGNSTIESLGIAKNINIVPWRVKNFWIKKDNDKDLFNGDINCHPSEFSIKKVYNISESGKFEDFTENNMVGFLGIKHKDGFTLLNSAFHDKYLGEDIFTQTAVYPKSDDKNKNGYIDAEFKNFAYQLYLIFSNTYHKNKQAEEKLFINIRNNVSVNKYEAQLTKDIIVKLSAENLNNIVFRSYNFNDYKDEIIRNLKEPLPEEFENSNNITLNFLDSAVNNVLSINYITRPLYDEGENTSAYILRNGQLEPCEILADNVFYIYLNKELLQFSNGRLEFDPGDVDINIKYLFINPEDNHNITRLDGLENLTKVVLDTPEKLYIEYFLEAFRNYKFDLKEVIEITPSYYRFNPKSSDTIENDTRVLINKIIEEIHNNIPAYIKGTHKNDILNEELKDLLRLNLVTIQVNTYGKTYTLNLITVELFYRNQNLLTKDVYTFNTGLNLTSYFDYNNEISIKKDAYLSYFGIVDTPEDNDPCSFTGFIKDIVLDRTFLVI